MTAPWPAQCPLGGVAFLGYGPGQGDLNGFSGEVGLCGFDIALNPVATSIPTVVPLS
jgi:hypothetical protein